MSVKSEIVATIAQLKIADADNAYHDLLEIDAALVPELIGAYHAESDSRIRVKLVEIIGEHRRGEPSHALSTCPGDALVQEKTADTLVLELFGNGDRDFRSIRSVWLQAEVPDDQLVIAPVVVDDRNETLSMVVIGRTED